MPRRGSRKVIFIVQQNQQRKYDQTERKARKMMKMDHQQHISINALCVFTLDL